MLFKISNISTPDRPQFF